MVKNILLSIIILIISLLLGYRLGDFGGEETSKMLLQPVDAFQVQSKLLNIFSII